MAIDTGRFSIRSLDMDKSWPLASICSSASPPLGIRKAAGGNRALKNSKLSAAEL